MKQKPLATVLFVFFSILTLVGSTYASMVFGPKNFTINRWHYHFSFHSFAVDTSGKGELTVTRTSSTKEINDGFIIINFHKIPLEKFIHGNKQTITKKIKLRGKNRILVYLRGKPGSTITIGIDKEGSTQIPVASLTADPTSIVQGKSSILTWSTSYADLITIEPEIGEVDSTGSMNVSPNETTTYTLTAKGAGGAATAQTEVKVTLPPPIVNFTAEPDTIAPGDSSTLSWSSKYATTCTVEPDIGDVAINGSLDIVPDKTTTYTITAVGPGGTSRATVLLQLYPIKIPKITKSEAHYTTPENTAAATNSSLLQHDLVWFHEAFTNEAVAYEKQLYADAGIDQESSFDLVDENDEEYILDKKVYKDGLLLVIEKKANDIDGTIIKYGSIFIREDNLWKVTFKYSGDEELAQYDDIQYTNCIASYSFTPNFLDDSCWHGNDLTNYNGTAGALDKRYDEDLTVAVFNGINNGLGRNQLNDMPRERLSMGGWIKAEHIDHNARIIEIGQDRDDSTAIVIDAGNGLRYWVHVEGRRIEGTAAMDYDFHDNQWHHVYLTYDGIAVKLYVDGQLRDSRLAEGLIDSAPILNIGQRNAAVYNGTANTFKGRLDDIQIYNKALTADEIIRKFENGTTQPL
jgi:hypothetical protein